MEQNNTKQLIGIAVKLLAICTIVAVIVALVYSVTKDKIDLNEKVNTAEALDGIYSEEYGGLKFSVSDSENSPAFVMKDADGNTVVSCDEAKTELISDVTALYVINDANGNTVSYCVSVAPMGFKDTINMLVAVNPDVSVKGVKIVSMSETSGIGTKAAEPEFLEKFNGLGSPVSSKVDTISGATKTSKPVIGAVDTALRQTAEYIKSNGGLS